MAMPVKIKEEATHRYPTSVHWGPGYFNDGYKYIKANSDDDALEFAPDFVSEDCVQRFNKERKVWEYIKL